MDILTSGTANGRGLMLPLVLTLLIAPTALCQGTTAAEKQAAEDDIRETVIRKQMQDWSRGGDKSEKEAKDATERAIAKELNFKIFFVSINGKDPSDDLVKRLQDIPRKVKKVSASEISKRWRMAVLDKETGERGIIFRADAIHWVTKDSVEVEGGYHCDGLCGLGVIFTLRMQGGKWVISGERMLWIS